MLSICIEAIHVGSADADPDPAKWRVTYEMMEKEIGKVRRAKKEHSVKAKRRERVIGFGV